jgi:hypothetical protein
MRHPKFFCSPENFFFTGFYFSPEIFFFTGIFLSTGNFFFRRNFFFIEFFFGGAEPSCDKMSQTWLKGATFPDLRATKCRNAMLAFFPVSKNARDF